MGSGRLTGSRLMNTLLNFGALRRATTRLAEARLRRQEARPLEKSFQWNRGHSLWARKVMTLLGARGMRARGAHGTGDSGSQGGSR